MSVISVFDGAARAFFDGSIAVDRFADRIACAARWGFRGMGNLPRWTRGECREVAAATNGSTCSHTPAHSHRSELHRLFLGGLLPSRARVRFAGSLTVRHHMTLMQPHLIQLSPFPAPGKNRSCEQNAIGEDGVSRFRFRSGL